MMNLRRNVSVLAASAALLLGSASAPALGGDRDEGGGGGRYSTVTELSGPRGVDSLWPGITLVSEGDASFSLVVERGRGSATKVRLGAIAGAEGIAPAVAAGPDGTVYLLTTAGAPGSPGGKLFRWRFGQGAPEQVADIADYQSRDLDPYDLEDAPEESNPYGLTVLRDQTVLVVDAAGNDLLRVWPDSGRIRTVAEIKPRTVKVPEGLPETDPDGNPLPPAGTRIPSESVPTSVTVGADGYWYVGELRGFPATPGTSQIWRIRPGSTGATCGPQRRGRGGSGACTRYADGFTSITDLTSDRRGNLYALSLSKLSWLAMELEVPGADVGGLFKVDRRRNVRELARDRLTMPGGVDVARNGTIYGVGPLFGPGSLFRIG